MAQSLDAIVVLITAANSGEASRIADLLVTNNLAACVQVLPGMQSVYSWKGQIEHAQEILLIAKTVADKFDALQDKVRSVHSYETPEIIAVPIVAGSKDYLKWLTSSLEGS